MPEKRIQLGDPGLALASLSLKVADSGLKDAFPATRDVRMVQLGCSW